MKHVFIALVLLLGFSQNSLAGSEVLIVSITKNVPLESAETVARALEFHDVSMGASGFIDARVTSYIPYDNCVQDSTCPYWSVALVELRWDDDTKYEAYMAKLHANPDYLVYSNGRVGPLPVVSGGN